MPRTVFEKKSRHSKLQTMLYGESRKQGRSREEMAAAAGVGPSTLTTRFASPGEFRLDELLNLCRSMNIPIEDLRQAITY